MSGKNGALVDDEATRRISRRGRSRQTWIAILRKPLANAARTAVCTTSVTPHRLRHTFATTMLRLGVSLPALMQLLGHKDIHMTLLYLDVTQQDLQREFHCARQKAASLQPIPKLPLPQATATLGRSTHGRTFSSCALILG
jgi:integrase